MPNGRDNGKHKSLMQFSKGYTQKNKSHPSTKHAAT